VTKLRMVLAVAAMATLGGCGLRFSRGPYVMSMADGDADVMFRLARGRSLPDGTVVEMLDADGAVLASAEPKCNDAGTYRAALRLPNPGRAAAYRFRAAEKTLCRPFPVTLPCPDAPTRLIIYGDTRSLVADHRAVSRAMAREKGVQAVFHVGDFVGDGTKEPSWNREFFAPGRAFLSRSALFPILGNHEKRGAPYFEAFAMDPAGGYYARRIGKAHFAVVDLYQEWEPPSDQHAWLAAELAAVPEGVYKIVVFHEPPFSARVRRTHSLKIVRGLLPVFDRTGVDLVFCGHDHYYMRSAVIGPAAGGKGITYITTGGGGAPRYEPEPASWYKVANDLLHYVVMDIDAAGRLTLSARNTRGRQFDHYALAAPGGQTAELAWGPIILTQEIQTGLANALQDNFLIDAELKRGQPVAKTFALPLTNPADAPLEVTLEVKGWGWKVDLPKSEFTIAPGATVEAAVAVAHDGKTARYPTPRITCSWSLGTQRGKDIEVALFLSAAPEGDLTAVSERLILDGMLTERFWRRLPKLGYLLREDGRGLATAGTDIFVAAGADGLYVAADCEEPKMRGVRARAKRHDDDALWQDDCVELFIEPVKGSGVYYQMVVSITGHRFDAKGKDTSWDAPWAAAVQKSQSGWSFEARIPWASLGLPRRPAAGTQLGFNVGRTRNAVRELSQWSRIPSGDSHTPEKFGTLTVK